MGHLIIHHLTFAFSTLNENREISLTNFIRAGSHARKNGDIIHATKDLAEYKFSWGQFHSDFAYSNWNILKEDVFWDWLPQPLHQLLTIFFYQNPSGQSDYFNIEQFNQNHTTENSGVIGCNCAEVENLDVYDIPSWHLWRNTFYQIHPEKYNWEDGDDDFLPNKNYSDTLLMDELRFHNKADKIQDNKLGVAFHDEVMRHKGPTLRSYAVRMGTAIAEANYYRLEEQLSSNEQKAWGAPRKIFSFLNRDGETIYISIDHAHGMFEYHNAKGEHLGEYKFDGSFNSGPDITHSLRTL